MSASRRGAPTESDVRKRWPKLTEDDVERVGQDKELLLDLLLERYDDQPRDQLEAAVNSYLARELTP